MWKVIRCAPNELEGALNKWTDSERVEIKHAMQVSFGNEVILVFQYESSGSNRGNSHAAYQLDPRLAELPVPNCPECGVPMVLKYRNKDGCPFYGCSTWSETKCKGIINVDDWITDCEAEKQDVPAPARYPNDDEDDIPF